MLIEAVISPLCPVVGLTVRQGRFRSRYDAIVMAVARYGKRLRENVEEIELRPADVLLLEARDTFVEQQRNSRDFILISPIDDSSPASSSAHVGGGFDDRLSHGGGGEPRSV